MNLPPNSDTAVVRKIMTELVRMNDQLHDIESLHTWQDYFRTLSLLITPFIVGYILFRLNKAKEYRVKKSEIYGEIYKCMYEIRVARIRVSIRRIEFFAQIRIMDLLNSKAVTAAPNTIEQLQQENTKLTEEIVSFVKEITISKTNMSKYIGQYRFYLKKSERKELDVLMQPLRTGESKWMRIYDYSKLNTVQEVRKQEQAYYDSNFPEMEKALDKEFSEVEIFFDQRS